MYANDAKTRAGVVETCLGMSERGLSKGTSGNVSVRLPDGFLISPTGIPYGEMRPDHVVHVRPDGTFEGEVLPSSEWRFHQAILDSRPDLNAVVHTHSVHATAVSIMERDIP